MAAVRKSKQILDRDRTEITNRTISPDISQEELPDVPLMQMVAMEERAVI